MEEVFVGGGVFGEDLESGEKFEDGVAEEFETVVVVDGLEGLGRDREGTSNWRVERAVRRSEMGKVEA